MFWERELMVSSEDERRHLISSISDVMDLHCSRRREISLDRDKESASTVCFKDKNLSFKE